MKNSETIVGRVTIDRELLPRDIHITVRGNGKAVLVVAGEVRHLGVELALPFLYEVARSEFPTIDVPDVGPGPFALQARVTELQNLVNSALADHAELSTRLREAEAANEALTDQLQLARAEIESLAELALKGKT